MVAFDALTPCKEFLFRALTLPAYIVIIATKSTTCAGSNLIVPVLWAGAYCALYTIVVGSFSRTLDTHSLFNAINGVWRTSHTLLQSIVKVFRNKTVYAFCVSPELSFRALA